MSKALYFLGISCYHLAIHLAAFFSPKARAWVAGRKNWQTHLAHWRQAQDPNRQLIWMHCASLGEFEQGRPVLEGIRQHYPDYLIVLSFYSPSGYEQQKQYAQADYVCYLPADGPAHARTWVDILQPKLVLFVKYEFWHFHLRALFARQIPTVLIAAAFRPEQLFFRWHGAFFRDTLAGFQHLFVQQVAHLELLQAHGFQQASVAGDPRMDRVLEIAQQPIDFPHIDHFAAGHQLFVAGSTWPPGERMLLVQQSEWWSKDWKLLLAPHDISEPHIQAILSQLQLPYSRYSELNETSDLANCRILVLDTIGMLSRVYHYGDLAYVGGGFGRSIHNTLEPAAHGLPVLFGPRHEKFPEAEQLITMGGGFCLAVPDDFTTIFQRLKSASAHENAQRAVHQFLTKNQGATTSILAKLENLQLL